MNYIVIKRPPFARRRGGRHINILTSSIIATAGTDTAVFIECPINKQSSVVARFAGKGVFASRDLRVHTQRQAHPSGVYVWAEAR